ncbi:Hypothetical protein PBC10988_15520 [Planctomycetales bacterium 10988]|nr:Hypothetical protein PBC10988_15520 [Planctomycetales bacterium 10988]
MSDQRDNLGWNQKTIWSEYQIVEHYLASCSKKQFNSGEWEQLKIEPVDIFLRGLLIEVFNIDAVVDLTSPYVQGVTAAYWGSQPRLKKVWLPNYSKEWIADFQQEIRSRQKASSHEKEYISPLPELSPFDEEAFTREVFEEQNLSHSILVDLPFLPLQEELSGEVLQQIEQLSKRRIMLYTEPSKDFRTREFNQADEESLNLSLQNTSYLYLRDLHYSLYFSQLGICLPTDFDQIESILKRLQSFFESNLRLDELLERHSEALFEASLELEKLRFENEHLEKQVVDLEKHVTQQELRYRDLQQQIDKITEQFVDELKLKKTA